MPGFAIEGRSRIPLLDARRAIKRTGGPTGHRVDIFCEGRSEPDMTCTVEAGAALTVRSEGLQRFVKYREFDRAADDIAEAAE